MRDEAWEASFAELERAQGITLAESQRQAVRQAYTAKVSVLTGGPGVGKTTALRALLNVLEANNVRYCLAAPTGRAAKRMTEATGRPASTLHRLLEYIPSNNDFGYNEHRPLPYQFVIVDEVSMLDILLAYRLVRAVAVGGEPAAGRRRGSAAFGRTGQRPARHLSQRARPRDASDSNSFARRVKAR